MEHGHGNVGLEAVRSRRYNINLRDPKTISLIQTSAVASSIGDHDPRGIDPSNGITPVEATVNTERTLGGSGTTTP